MKKLLILLLSIMIVSCTRPTKTVRVQKVLFLQTENVYYSYDSITYIWDVDTLHKIGDIIESSSNNYYRIVP